MVWFKDASSSYQTAKLGELRLNPITEMIHELRQDYKAMEVMMTGDYPTFEKVI
jgi:hypothetical protein